MERLVSISSQDGFAMVINWDDLLASTCEALGIHERLASDKKKAECVERFLECVRAKVVWEDLQHMRCVLAFLQEQVTLLESDNILNWVCKRVQ